MQTMNTTKLNSLLVFALVMLFSFTAAAQDYTFKVISKKGSAQVGGNELKVGTKIQNGQSITVGASTLLNIAHSNGKSINISKAGTYKVDDLAKGCVAQGNSLASKYADFVLKELTSGDDGGVRGKNMRKPGSVVRAPGEENAALVFAAPGKKMKVAPSEITLKCFINDDEKAKVKLSESEISKYTFVVTDFMGDKLATIESKEPMVTIDLSEKKYAQAAGAITYYAYVNDNPKAKSADYVLDLIKGAEAKQIADDASTLAADDSALGHLILARFFEEKGLHANAIYAYETALKKSENNEMYEQVYQAFLDRNYMSKKSKKSMKDNQ